MHIAAFAGGSAPFSVLRCAPPALKMHNNPVLLPSPLATLERRRSGVSVRMQHHPENKDNIAANARRQRNSLAAGVLLWSALAQASAAKSGAFGVLETPGAGMAHPVGMALLYILTISAGYHGWQWRQSRLLGYGISELMKSSSEEDKARAKELQTVRTKILSSGHRDKHFQQSSLILGAGVLLAIEGGFSTWWRVGELFPGSGRQGGPLPNSVPHSWNCWKVCSTFID